VELTQTPVNAFVVAALGVVLSRMVSGFRCEIRDDIKGLRSEIGQLRGEMHEEIRGVRSDLTQVALAVGAQPRAETQ
jgi:hypothetical protein